MPDTRATILLVDDDSIARPFLVRCLRDVGGYHVLEAATAAEAVRICTEFEGPIGLLITDVNLEADHGRSLAHRLCLLRAGMPVLFISGADAGDLANRGLLDRRAAFLQKPFLPKVLLGLVSEMIP